VLERTGWGDVPPGDATPLPTRAPAAAPPAYTHRADKQLTQTHVVLGAPMPAHADPRRFALSLVSMVLGGGMSSRLFQRVREELGLAYAVHTFQSFHVDVGMQGVYVASAPETARQAVDAIRGELTRLVDEGLPADELAAAKRQLKGQVTLGQESVTNRMYRAAAQVLYDEPFRPLDAVLAEIDAIDEAGVREVAREFFAPERQTVLSLGPKKVA
jgi:predicted Zn-dependent peptidase